MAARAPKTRAPTPNAAASTLFAAPVLLAAADALEVPLAAVDDPPAEVVVAEPVALAAVETTVPVADVLEDESVAVAEEEPEAEPVLVPAAGVDTAPAAQVAAWGRSLTPLPAQRELANLMVASRWRQSFDRVYKRERKQSYRLGRPRYIRYQRSRPGLRSMACCCRCR